MLNSRFRICLTLEESSPWVSLMARDIALGPSDVPCPVETSTAHDGFSSWTTVSHSEIDKGFWCLAYASVIAHSLFPPMLLLPEILSSSITSSLPVSRHTHISPCSAKTKLGFLLEGLESKIGPSAFSRPKPTRCFPTLHGQKPSTSKIRIMFYQDDLNFLMKDPKPPLYVLEQLSPEYKSIVTRSGAITLLRVDLLEPARISALVLSSTSPSLLTVTILSSIHSFVEDLSTNRDLTRAKTLSSICLKALMESMSILFIYSFVALGNAFFIMF
ncbi:hypothetical protein ISN44_As08g030710 [Arabidopsis suecica]|uniref:Uncharacterized protein n=1 Tax=Arabidopsis suecica TaxID=45249 RepID=A0A8T2BI56_ARASU|nr:hypothetical protein ISN44_As08g030710 [Arabidopsis suecica]